jgi:WD40 repeat protein
MNYAGNYNTWSPDSKLIASSTDTGSIMLLNSDTGKVHHRLTGHNGIVTTIVWSPDGTKIASGSIDKTIIIWNSKTGHHIQTIKGHIFGVTSLGWSPDGLKIVSGSIDNTIRIWSACNGEQLDSIDGHEATVSCVAWSPDSKRIVSGSNDCSVCIWNSETTALEKIIYHGDSILTVVWSPDGTQVLSDTSFKTSIFNACTGERIKTEERRKDSGTDTDTVGTTTWYLGSRGVIALGVSIHRDDGDYYIVLTNICTGKIINKIRVGVGRRSSVYDYDYDSVYNISLSPDGEKILYTTLTCFNVLEDRGFIIKNINREIHGNKSIQGLIRMFV